MRTWLVGSFAILCAGMAGIWLVTAPSQARSERGNDQVIVKFTAQSEAGRALAQMDLATIGQPAEDARLNEIARAFGERIGIPVRLENLTSGRELLLAVDQERLAAALAERLRQRDDVRSVEVADPAEAGAPRLAVELEPGSALAATVAREPRVALDPLPGTGGSPVAVEAAVQSLEGDRAVLTLDLDALVSGLVARLEAEPDVQYAQRNLRLRPYPVSTERRG
jgi:hypothetical protein